MGLAITSTSDVDNGITSIVPIINSFPALYTKLREGKCLTYIGREGGWGEYFKRAQSSGVLDRLNQWVARRVRAYMAKRWRNTYWRRYPDQYLYGQLGLVRLYALRRDFFREFTAQHRRQPLCRA